MSETEIKRMRAEYKAIRKQSNSYQRALIMILQIQDHPKTVRAIANAALAGADLTDNETAIKVCEGKWSKP